jgi:hypothetical protein
VSPSDRQDLAAQFRMKNAARKEQDRRSKEGKFSRQLRKAMGGKFGNKPAAVANICGRGTPGWEERLLAHEERRAALAAGVVDLAKED